MITENLSILKIHQLSQEQYNKQLSEGNIDENALYLTPQEEYADKNHTHEEYADKNHDHDEDYAEKEHTHEITDVNELQELIVTSAYIDIEDNEDVEDPYISIEVDSALSDTSENPVQNKVITENLNEKLSLPKSNNAVNYGEAGQFAVSDGNGGLTWRTLFEGEEVAY